MTDLDELSKEFGGSDYKDPQVLERLYWEENLSIRDMGEVLDVSHTTVRNHMDKNGIGRKNRIEASKEGFGLNTRPSILGPPKGMRNGAM